MSGINPVLMNAFCNEGMETLSNYTPWITLDKILNDNRYSILQNYANDYLHNK